MQIENRVRWRESVINMIGKDINQFIEIGIRYYQLRSKQNVRMSI